MGTLSISTQKQNSFIHHLYNHIQTEIKRWKQRTVYHWYPEDIIASSSETKFNGPMYTLNQTLNKKVSNAVIYSLKKCYNGVDLYIRSYQV